MLSKYIKSSCKATFLLCLLCSNISWAQNVSDELNAIHGNFQVDAQVYNPDSLIGAPPVPEKFLSNVWGNINYIKGKLSAGIRYEAYNNVMQGFDQRYRGQGITNRFVRYQDKLLDITIGHIYEQFGSGLIFRTYFEPGLLYDNALDGVRVISNPYKGITLKALTGRQRTFFSLSPGIVRGFDGEINFNELFDSMIGTAKTRVILGGSFVSKYEPETNPDFVMPENVGAYGGRLNVIHEGFSFFGEYVRKENDPSLANFAIVNGRSYYSYKDGEAAFISASYARRGFSILFQGKRIDNMSFRSDRDATLQNLLINYLPATTRQHTYLMPAYSPYATQPQGEIGSMIETQFKLKKGSLLGGKYGTEITLNYSHANGLRQINVDDSTSTSRLYRTEYLENKPVNSGSDAAPFLPAVGEAYYHDMFIEINKKFSPKWKATLMLANQFNNLNVVQHGVKKGPYKNAKSNIGVLDLTYKYSSNAALRFETQVMLRDNNDSLNMGSWAVGMIEWTPNTNVFIAVLDQYNYGNPVDQQRLHYFLVSAGYTTGAHRISMSYGKQRQGIFCVGGVCRVVPASNGIAISITSSF